jgi:hypothetical protein
MAQDAPDGENCGKSGLSEKCDFSQLRYGGSVSTLVWLGHATPSRRPSPNGLPVALVRAATPQLAAGSERPAAHFHNQSIGLRDSPGDTFRPPARIAERLDPARR